MVQPLTQCECTPWQLKLNVGEIFTGQLGDTFYRHSYLVILMHSYSAIMSGSRHPPALSPAGPAEHTAPQLTPFPALDIKAESIRNHE